MSLVVTFVVAKDLFFLKCTNEAIVMNKIYELLQVNIVNFCNKLFIYLDFRNQEGSSRESS